MSDDVESIESVLEGHPSVAYDSLEERWRCDGCGERLPWPQAGDSLATMIRAHVARVLAARDARVAREAVLAAKTRVEQAFRSEALSYSDQYSRPEVSPRTIRQILTAIDGEHSARTYPDGE